MYKNIIMQLITFSILMFAQHSYAITVESLSQKLKQGEKLTLIDIRINLIYQNGHIYNAINIPASIIEHKRLPPLGNVFVYGDGIDEEVVERAVEQLNRKPGINAESLDGGYTAWSSRKTVVHSKREVGISRTIHISYSKLHNLAQRPGSLILLDLRMGKQLESLESHFPDIRIHDAVNAQRDDVSNSNAGRDKVNRGILAGIPKQNKKALILIDDGNGLSEKVAEKLHAAGVKRLAILTGGERALRTRGESTEEVRRLGD